MQSYSMSFFELYPTREFEEKFDQMNATFVELTKKLSELVPSVFDSSYNLWERDKLPDNLNEKLEPYIKSEIGPELKRIFDEMKPIFDFIHSSVNDIKTYAIVKRKKLLEHKDVIELLMDEDFKEFFPPIEDEIENPVNPLMEMIKAYTTVLVSQAIGLQLKKKDLGPVKEDYKVLGYNPRPWYSIFDDSIISGEYAKIKYILIDESLNKLELDLNKDSGLVKLREELLKIEKDWSKTAGTKRLEYLKDKAIEYLDGYFEELPRLLQYGVTLHQMAKNPEAREHWMDDKKYFEVVKPILERVPGLKLKTSIYHGDELHVLGPQPTISDIIDATIFCKHITNFRY